MDLEHTAIERIQKAHQMSVDYYQEPLMICISGGKDSSVLTELAIRSGCPVEFSHNHTTADAPETVRFVRQEFKRLEEKGYKCTLNLPTYKGKRTSMWNLIPQKQMPPTRLVRYCCQVLKETGGENRFICTGVRWAESARRKANRGIYEKASRSRSPEIMIRSDNDDTRQLFENCRMKGKRVANPIIDWKDQDIWDFVGNSKCPLNPLYAEGWCRVGCIGCPMAGTKGREKEFLRWPAYKNLYIKAFDRMLEHRERTGLQTYGFQNGKDVFNWWMEYDILPGQMNLFEEIENENT